MDAKTLALDEIERRIRIMDTAGLTIIGADTLRALLSAAREAEALRASNAALVAALECMACFKCGYPPASKNGGCPHCKNARTLMGGGK